MHRSAEPRPLTATIEVTASPEVAWRVIADVRRTGEWSPECVRVVPLGRLGTGSLLLGLNRRGRVRWVTLSRVISFDPGRQIGWRVLTNRSEWFYRLTPDGAGTRIAQTRRTPRGEGRFAVAFTRLFLGGQAGHDDELERGMAAGLQRIAHLVQAGPTEAGAAG